MEEILQYAHGYILGYGLLGFVSILTGWSAYFAVLEEEMGKPANIFSRAVTGLLDLQILLGVTFFLSIGKPWGDLLTHPLFMVVGTVLVHVGNRKEGWTQVGFYGGALFLLASGWHFVL